jgi:hypothetical protein
MFLSCLFSILRTIEKLATFSGCCVPTLRQIEYVRNRCVFELTQEFLVDLSFAVFRDELADCVVPQLFRYSPGSSARDRNDAGTIRVRVGSSAARKAATPRLAWRIAWLIGIELLPAVA